MSAVAVVGAGPAGLMAAERLAAAGHVVTIHESMPSPARKFLLAGRGGLNLTHGEPLDAFLARYREAAPRLGPLVRRFDPAMLRDWSAELGEETFVGSSGRVFPKSFKASPLLRAWLRRLAAQGVTLQAGHMWTGFAPDGGLRFRAGGEDITTRPDAAVLALGGASWPRLGSTGAWTAAFAAEDIGVAALRPSNCGFAIGWSAFLEERHAGEPLKRIAISFAGETARGEAMITADGLEGGPVYVLSGPVREAVRRDGFARITLDLRPDIEAKALVERLSAGRKGDSLGNRLRKQAGLSPAAVAVLRETFADLASRTPGALTAAVKAVPLKVKGVRPIDRAISSAGGVRWDELDDGLMLLKRPGVFIAGEMIDWEAPTGGYLLQACFATGAAAAEGAAAWLSRTGPAVGS
jgi:uncharacterized flavoprotein (TIGR03862 family)